MIDVKKLASEIMCLEVEHSTGGISDNVATMLCSFFEDSTNNPGYGGLDEFCEWDQWSVDQVNLIESEIVKLFEKYLCQN